MLDEPGQPPVWVAIFHQPTPAGGTFNTFGAPYLAPNGEVVFYRIDGGGHTWPGSDQTLPIDVGSTTHALQGTVEIARFFGLVD